MLARPTVNSIAYVPPLAKEGDSTYPCKDRNTQPLLPCRSGSSLLHTDIPQSPPTSSHTLITHRHYSDYPANSTAVPFLPLPYHAPSFQHEVAVMRKTLSV